MAESVNQAFAQALQIEAAQSRNPFDVYLDLRLRDTAVFRATRFTNNLQEQPSEALQQEYRDALSSASTNLTSLLEIDPAFASDPRYAEMFFAICDSWAVNEKRDSKDDEYEQEKQFLLRTTRVLVGNRSKFNINAYSKQEKGAENYVDDFDTEYRRREIELFHQLEQSNNAERSQRLADLFADRGQGSFLEKPREKLGITSPEQEKIFQIVVPAASSSEAWVELVRDAPAFVQILSEAGDQALLVRADYYQRAIEQGERHENAVIRHEWAHAQGVQANIGVDGQLGLVLEEERADICAEGYGHVNSKYVVDIVEFLVGGNELRNEFQKAMKIDGDISDLYRFVANKYGVRSLLLLMTIRPPGYPQPNGVGQIPDIATRPEQRMTDLLQQICYGFKKTSPDLMQRFIDRLRNNLGENDANTIRFFYPSPPLRTTKIPDELRQVIETVYKEKFGKLPSLT